jgi:hypothetical protein
MIERIATVPEEIIYEPNVYVFYIRVHVDSYDIEEYFEWTIMSNPWINTLCRACHYVLFVYVLCFMTTLSTIKWTSVVAKIQKLRETFTAAETHSIN